VRDVASSVLSSLSGKKMAANLSKQSDLLITVACSVFWHRTHTRAHDTIHGLLITNTAASLGVGLGPKIDLRIKYHKFKKLQNITEQN